MQEIASGVLVETALRGVTIGAIRTSEGYVLIDTPTFPSDAENWRKSLRTYANVPILAIIMLDSHRDRLLGASWFDVPMLISHRLTLDVVSSISSAYVSTIANLVGTTALDRSRLMAGRILHPTITFGDHMRLHFGDTTIHLRYRPGPTSGSIWVHAENHDIVFVGDSVVVNTPPHLTSPHSQLWLDALGYLETEWAKAKLVTGRGDLASIEDIEPLRQYLQLSRQRVQFLYENRRPLSELSSLINQLMELYPTPQNYELDEVQQRVRTALQFIYNEFRESELGSSKSSA